VLAGRYRLERLLAVGGMAEVWHAQDELLHRAVAVKVLHRHLATDPSFVARFRAEAVAAGRLHHPGIVAVFDHCSDDGLEAIVLELVRGHTLRQHLDDGGPMPVLDVVDVGCSVAEALSVAHAAGLIHRDVKPANILLCDDDRVMITDFGIAKAADDADRTATGMMLGSVKYLAPEQVEGRDLDARADLFSLGVVLHECLTGAPPWSADTPAATALARLHQVAPPIRSVRPDVPVALQAVVQRSLRVDPAARFRDARSMRAALSEVRAELAGGPQGRPTAPVATVDEGTVVAPAPSVAPPVAAPAASPSATVTAPAPPPGPAARSTTARRRRRWPALLAVGALFAVAGLVAALLVGGTDPGRRVLDGVGAGRLATTSELGITVVPYDPEGTGTPGENDELAPYAVDGDPGTAWQSEGYDDPMGRLKSGVGLVATLDERHEVREVTVRSPREGWAASIYVGDGTPAALEGWGEPVARAEGIDGDHTFRFDGVEGRSVLVWFTDLGAPDPRYRMEVSELTVRG
jgi:serine/threonine-protein kinase